MFLGNANFLPGQADEGRVTCELGSFATTCIHTGQVEVMIRPEDVGLTLNPSGPAEIVEREYYGHDQLLKVCLASGHHLYSRLLGSEGDFQPAQRVDLQVRHEVVVYPA
jgi:iron(III) transport system ATP-binding protein